MHLIDTLNCVYHFICKQHPFIIKLLYAFETEDSFYLGLEYMGGGDLFNYLERVHVLPEDKAR
jgi:serine/threonine protein kinase